MSLLESLLDNNLLFQYASTGSQLVSWLDEVKANGGNSVRKLNFVHLFNQSKSDN